MSCTFWNMRRKLKAKQKEDNGKVVVNLAEAQKEADPKKKPRTKAVEKK